MLRRTARGPGLLAWMCSLQFFRHIQMFLQRRQHFLSEAFEFRGAFGLVVR